MRADDNGNEVEVARVDRREDAERIARDFEARGHKQIYWVEPIEASGRIRRDMSARPL